MRILVKLLTVIIFTATYSLSLQAEEVNELGVDDLPESDMFYPDTRETAKERKVFCRKHGIKCIYPFDKKLGVAYLAGPDVFYPDAIETAEKKKAFCRKHGIKCIFPLDAKIDNFPDKLKNDPAGLAFEIFQNNIDIMRCSDVVLANMTPFRGPSMDAGTSFEMGFMKGLGRTVLAYTVSSFDSPLNFKERTHRYVEAIGENLMEIRNDDGIVIETRDHNDHQIEDFGLIDNLMMPGAVQASGSQIFTDDSNIMNSFEASVLEAKKILQSRVYSINYLRNGKRHHHSCRKIIQRGL